MEGTFLRSSNTTNEQGISFKGPQYLEILIKFYTVPLVFLVFQNPPPQNSNPFCEGVWHIVSDRYLFSPNGKPLI